MFHLAFFYNQLVELDVLRLFLLLDQSFFMALHELLLMVRKPKLEIACFFTESISVFAFLSEASDSAARPEAGFPESAPSSEPRSSACPGFSSCPAFDSCFLNYVHVLRVLELFVHV